MKFTGKAFLAGFAGTLGAGTAVVAVIATLTLIGARQLKQRVTEFENRFRECTEEMLGEPTATQPVPESYTEPEES